MNTLVFTISQLTTTLSISAAARNTRGADCMKMGGGKPLTIVFFAVVLLSVAVDAQTSMPMSPATEAQEQFKLLVNMRLKAIDVAFGPVGFSRTDIRIKFVGAHDADYAKATPAAYDGAQHTFIFRRELLGMLMDGVPRFGVQYWPYYKSVDARDFFPLVQIVDDILWSAYLQEAAAERGLNWPHEGCGSLDIAQRLGCEMLMAGVSDAVRSVNGPMFNMNRLDRLWPEDLRQLGAHAWRQNDRDYLDVRRLGGICLIQPLVRQFGVPRVFAYVAQTPFRIESNNVKLSALRYQERARTALQW